MNIPNQNQRLIYKGRQLKEDKWQNKINTVQNDANLFIKSQEYQIHLEMLNLSSIKNGLMPVT